MIPILVQRLKLSAIFALAFALAFPVSATTEAEHAPTSHDVPIANIYKGNEIVYEVFQKGPVLGEGKFGIVEKAVIRRSNGETGLVGLKTLIRAATAVAYDKSKQYEDTEKRWQLMQPIFADDQERVLTHGEAGLRYVPVGQNADEKEVRVIVTELADGSVSSQLSSLLLNPKDAAYETKLATVAKLHHQVLTGIQLMSSHGMNHGDIKPDNILYVTDPGFDWQKPDPEHIRFPLTDFDSATPLGERFTRFTPVYAPPETFTKGRRTASPAWDIYSESITAYTEIFGSHPFKNYFDSIYGQPHTLAHYREDLFTAYSNRVRYEKMIKYVGNRFKVLEAQTHSPKALQTLKDLHVSIMNGLAYSPEERFRAFPEIHEGTMRFLQSRMNGKVDERTRSECIVSQVKLRLL
jgi:serine/threonine protein kinase